MLVIYYIIWILLPSLTGGEECLFGFGCVFPCHCSDNNECNRETGDCGERGCAEGWSGEGCQVGNVARDKPAFGSGSESNPPSHAVDGNTNSYASGTSDPARWTVDLGLVHVVQAVNITNFGESTDRRGRLQYTHIWLHNTVNFTTYTVCSYITQPTHVLGRVDVKCNKGAVGRYVTLIKDAGNHDDVLGEGYRSNILNFYEVEVIGYSYQFNAALNKSASQTAKNDSDSWSVTNPAALAVDGNEDRDQKKRLHCAHPQHPAGRDGGGLVWLRIDLGTTYTISRVKLVNPKNPQNHLRDTYVYITEDINQYTNGTNLCGTTPSDLDSSTDAIVDLQCDEISGRHVVLTKFLGSARYWAILICEVIVYVDVDQVSTACDGRFGPGCLSPCNCQTDCHAITGHCYGDCEHGWAGEDCQQACTPGKWGVNCIDDCKPGCDPSDSCSIFNGNCGQCKPHYTGQSCQFGYENWYTGNITVTPSTDTADIEVNLVDVHSDRASYKIFLNDTLHMTEQPGNSQSLSVTVQQLQPSSTYIMHIIPTFTYEERQYDGPISESVEIRTQAPAPLKRGGPGGDGGNAPLIAGVVVGVVVVVVVCTVLLLFVRRKIKHQSAKQEAYNASDSIKPERIAKEEKYENLSLKAEVSPKVSRKAAPEVAPDVDAGEYANVGAGAQANAVRVEDLHDYVLQRQEDSEAYSREYQELRSGMQHPAKCGERSANKNKDRFRNMQAYDHSRVVLKGLPEGGYINANYITGYKSASKEYIATIGPKQSTTNDFWRMIWQEYVTTIVMLTKLVELGKNKCHQYWPLEGSQQYGDVTVETVASDDYADYKVTTMSVTKQGAEPRIVRHFFFISWPDHGVPDYATAFLAFYYKTMKSVASREKRKRKASQPKGPLLVHCSAGVGRTGTYIALDILLKQAEQVGVVDMSSCVWNMRQERVNMVQTIDQYIFLHETLLEALSTESTMIEANDFISRTRAWSHPPEDNQLHRQYQSLEMFRRMTNPDEEATIEPNLAKNRTAEIIPPQQMRPFLTTPVKGTTDYINAVYINSFRKRDFFILTQHPLPSTTADFWRMVYDHSCASVISLTPPGDIDQNYVAYWPEDTESSSTFGPLEVTLQSDKPATAFPDLTVKELHIQHKTKSGDAPHRVKLYQTCGWRSGRDTPDTAGELSPMLSLVERWQQSTGDGPVVIQCQDGACRSGVVCSLMYVLEQLRVDHEVDLYTAVKHLLPRRPQLIQPFTQYQYLYEATAQHLESYSEYSNFK